MTNFDFLKSVKHFSSFADTAIAAELNYRIDTATSVVNCRRAMEFAVKWMYTVDSDLRPPYQDNLITLINTDEFRHIVGKDIFSRLNYIRKLGNLVNHTSKKITKEQSKIALKYLHYFMDFLAYSYNDDYVQNSFDETLLNNHNEEETKAKTIENFDELFKKLKSENEALKEELTKLRNNKAKSFVSTSIDMTEAETRNAYIDLMLNAAGWEKNKDWYDEYVIDNMPNKSGVGAADYVLFGDDGKPLAVIEAKRTSIGLEKGRQQAKLYADNLEVKFGKRPIIFLTNGIETHIWIDHKKGYPERQVSGIYSKRDLEKEFNLMEMRSKLNSIHINKDITERYYQREAITAVCESFSIKKRRKALLVMATGSGKTRTVISLIDVLLREGWITNFLFLADRNSLVTQAKRAFQNFLPQTSITNLVEDKENASARGVFSTYQTLMNQIDESTYEDGSPLYTPGHFDLIILDEAHRSIYNRYKDIFNYFDSLLVGLTATPKDEIDKNTYEIFDLEAGVPTYGYELKQAVDDGHLVDYTSIETKLKFIDKGIIYDELSEAEKVEYEELFANEDGEIPETIESSALNEWIFNKDTIVQVLSILLTKGLKVEYGGKIGKTIIFAKNHKHAEKIYEIWGKEYPNYPPDYCRVIDNYTNYAQSLIDDFSDPNKMPQIAISVDMLDTGIDIPEISNLVFFKKVLSKAKFWQMIGRGTRLCKGLLDGDDKKEFYIFDFCSNFEFFRESNGKGKEGDTTYSLQAQLFMLKAEIIYKLQDFQYQTDETLAFREKLINELISKITELNKDNFAVRQHIYYVDQFSKKETYLALKPEQLNEIKEHIIHILGPEKGDLSASRFDVLLHGIELAFISGKKYKKMRKDLMKKTEALTKYGTIPAIKNQEKFIEKVLYTDYFDSAGIGEFETIRERLRSLMQYIEHEQIKRYDTNFKDTILEISDENPPEYDTEELKNYKKKAEFYIKQHQDNNPVISKLKTNKPLNATDIKELEKILWKELGTKEQYQKEYGDKPLGELVRSIVGLDMKAAKEAFSEFLGSSNLNSKQIYFINKIIEYIILNGMLKDFRVLQESPFTDKGSVVELFEDINLWKKIKHTIDRINENALAA